MPRSNPGIEYLFKLGYTLVFVTIGLMIWASLVETREFDVSRHPPCAFNALCTCSKTAPDLGVVDCRHVSFPAIPRVINNSKLFMLHMDDTGLLDIEPYFFQATGLYRLDISNNPITEIPDEAFFGLERSLWELILQNNQLIEVPSRAIRHLAKLRMLNLRGNDISAIESGAFRGLDKSLQTLILADNSISQIAYSSVSGLPNLETIDLSGNNLIQVDPAAFKDGLNKLSKVYLGNNLLTQIPYSALQPLSMLRVLDLANNHIKNFGSTETNANYKLTLDVFQLQYNSISEVPSNSFTFFDTINSTFLDGNPINHIEDNAFRQAKMRELYIRHCGLDTISPQAFSGLESSLKILDLSGNNITHLSNTLFNGFDNLRFFNLKDNVIKQVDRNASPFTNLNLYRLDTTGNQNQPVTLEHLSKMKSLRSLATSFMPSVQLGPDDFTNFSQELEELKITRASLKVLNNHAFINLRGLKRLDLSENRIDKIEANAFTEIGHSLVSLRISHGFSSQMQQIPHESFRQLTSLEALDLSNNKLKSLADNSLHFMKNLVSLELHDNQIEKLQKGILQADIHTKLALVSFRYNNLKQIPSHSFVDLGELNTLYLDDNRIETIEKRAFMNLDHLKLLNLRGNKLHKIAAEAFQNLPELEKLDLAYNVLDSFEFDYFDQVGSLTSLEVDVSHNRIRALGETFEVPVNDSSAAVPNHVYNDRDYMFSHVNIKTLDMSSNNITKIASGYFKPVEMSLMKLSLASNQLFNASRDVFGNMPHLQWLDLEYNRISEMDYDTFKYTRKIQVLKLSHNMISDIPMDLFRNMPALRILEMAHNNLKYLPDSLVFEEGLERLDLSHNQFTKIPVTSLSNLAALALCELDLSHNHIGAIHSVDLSNKFRSLSVLDLSNNRLVRLEDAAFATLPRLSWLDLSHNDELEVMGKAFIGLEKSLIELRLSNVSLNTVPELSNPSLRILKISHNDLPSIPAELATNMASLRELDLSENDLTHVPIITHSLPNLKSLSLAGNPITLMTNTSLLGVADSLEHLDIANLNLNGFENGVLNKLHFLRTLRISSYPHIPSFNIPKILESAHNLRELWIQAPKSFEPFDHSSKPVSAVPSDLRGEMDGLLPRKLKSITFGGFGFNRLADNILQGIQSADLHVSFFNTSLAGLPTDLFKNMGKFVRNISLDLEYNNRLLKSVPNPNTAHYLHLPENMFLTDLRISGNSLVCDCELGWVEFWQRKRRQYMCPAQPWIENSSFNSYFRNHVPSMMSQTSDDCEQSADNLREATCSNKKNENLLEVLKTELECGWGSGATRLRIVPAIAFVSVFVVALI
ncbi:chaoptin [Toxorhynchites rutilus septentrionalis]|uniref:chaoptin n=1 Tax=Toxorhynchites rutilus septentrionalis TaxID=329112 RepID=UPI00247A71B2|nr:chaoptin [Toxorhynchites rutilus septentrionalis]